MRCKHPLLKFTGRALSILAFAMIFTLTSMANQQTITITGNVTSSSDGQGLPGVNIRVKGTGIGMITNIQGNYSIEVPGNDAVLVFSYIGYETQEVTVGTQRIIDMVLIESAQELEEKQD